MFVGGSGVAQARPPGPVIGDRDLEVAVLEAISDLPSVAPLRTALVTSSLTTIKTSCRRSSAAGCAGGNNRSRDSAIQARAHRGARGSLVKRCCDTSMALGSVPC